MIPGKSPLTVILNFNMFLDQNTMTYKYIFFGKPAKGWDESE
jgi:hypothetical protein